MSDMSALGRIYVSRHLGGSAMGMLEASPWPIDVHPDPDRPPAPDELLTAAKGCVGAVTLLTERPDAAFFDMVGDQLRVVASLAVGTENIDVEAASRRGVVVTNTPDVLTDSTAELTLALLLAAGRRVVESNRLLRGDWEWIWGPRLMLGRDLLGDVLGIVGYGRIGAAVARRAQAFGMRIVATGRQADSAEAQALGVRSVGFEELLSQSDAVSLHCPLLLWNTSKSSTIGSDFILATIGSDFILASATEHPTKSEPSTSRITHSPRESRECRCPLRAHQTRPAPASAVVDRSQTSVYRKGDHHADVFSRWHRQSSCNTARPRRLRARVAPSIPCRGEDQERGRDFGYRNS